VRQGPLAPEARGWHPCNPDDLLPLRAPSGIEDPPWQAARRLLVDDASEDAASFALRVAKSQGWEGGAGRMPRPLQMLLCVAIPYRNIVDSVRRETLAARDELLLDEAWNRAWRCCFWPMGLGASGLVHVATASRRRNAAPVHLAAWLLARGGFSRTLVGGVLVHLGAASVSASRQTARLAEIATREEHAGSADLVDLLQDQSGPPLLAWSRLEKARRLAGVEGGQERSAPEELFTALQEAWLAEWQMR
jgi:hypothetical protein